LNQFTEARILETSNAPVFEFSSNHHVNIDQILDGLKKAIPESAYFKTSLLGDIIKPGDYVLLITPIDNEAPDGRMILPQQMAIRDVLDNKAINIVLKEDQVENFIKNSGIKPRIAITDSQVFIK